MSRVFHPLPILSKQMRCAKQRDESTARYNRRFARWQTRFNAHLALRTRIEELVNWRLGR